MQPAVKKLSTPTLDLNTEPLVEIADGIAQSVALPPANRLIAGSSLKGDGQYFFRGALSICGNREHYNMRVK